MVTVLNISTDTLVLTSPDAQVSLENTDAGWLAATASIAAQPHTKLLVTVSTDACVAATFKIRRRKANAISPDSVGFAFENHVPVAIEDYLFDFAENGESVFAVATKARGPNVGKENLTQADILAFVPSAFLVFDGLRSQLTQTPCLIVFVDDERTHLIRFEEKRVHSWRCCACDDRTVARELAVMWLNLDTPVEHAYVTSGVSSHLFADNFEVHSLSVESEAARQQAIQDITSGRLRPTIDFNRVNLSFSGSLKPISRSLTTFLVIATICLGCLGFALLQRSWQHQAHADAYRKQQAALFRRLHPGERLPPGIRRRLESTLLERTNLTGKSAQLPADPRLLQQLSDVLEHVPSDLRVRIEHLNFNNGFVDLRGQLRSGGDVVVLREALSKTGLQIESPSTDQVSPKVVGFQMNASPAIEEAE